MAYVNPYVYTPQPKPRTGVARAYPVRPIRVVPPPRLIHGVHARGPHTVKVRYQTTGTNLGEYLGQVQLAALAVPSVKDLAAKALNSLIGIVDPGKKRDANRVARANIWCGLANAGSITAARRVLGGSHVQYTPKERQYYIDCWNGLLKSKPALAQQAISLGQLGIPEPGSDIAPPSIPEEDMSTLQNEIDAYVTAAKSGAALPAPGAKLALPAGINPAVALGAGVLLLKALL